MCQEKVRVAMGIAVQILCALFARHILTLTKCCRVLSLVAQQQQNMEFDYLLVTFRHPSTGKKIGSRKFDSNNLSLLRGYAHNEYYLWGVTNGKRKRIPRGVGHFTTNNNKIVWT